MVTQSNSNVTRYDNILSEELYKETFDYIKLLMQKNGDQFRTSMFNWNNALIGNSVPVLRYNFYAEDSEITKKIKKEVEDKIPYFIDMFSLHVWPNSSYITWHNDQKYIGALTIYLNQEWNENWGGYFMYQEGNEIKAIKPEKNLGVLQENKVNHAVTTTNTGANLRITLQFFLVKKKKML